MKKEPVRYRADQLVMFAAALLEGMALPEPRARTVAEVLVEADLLGYTTHGLDLLPAYLRALETGGMARNGEPQVVAETHRLRRVIRRFDFPANTRLPAGAGKFAKASSCTSRSCPV